MRALIVFGGRGNPSSPLDYTSRAWGFEMPAPHRPSSVPGFLEPNGFLEDILTGVSRMWYVYIGVGSTVGRAPAKLACVLRWQVLGAICVWGLWKSSGPSCAQFDYVYVCVLCTFHSQPRPVNRVQRVPSTRLVCGGLLELLRQADSCMSCSGKNIVMQAAPRGLKSQKKLFSRDGVRVEIQAAYRYFCFG